MKARHLALSSVMTIALLAGIGCSPRAALTICDAGKPDNVIYRDLRSREARWAANDGDFVVIASPLRLGGVVYEPFPATESFCTIVVLAETKGDRVTGRLTLVSAAETEELAVNSIAYDAADRKQATVTAHGPARIAHLEVTGPPVTGFDELVEEAEAILSASGGTTASR